jgi:hypothetical protein
MTSARGIAGVAVGVKEGTEIEGSGVRVGVGEGGGMGVTLGKTLTTAVASCSVTARSRGTTVGVAVPLPTEQAVAANNISVRSAAKNRLVILESFYRESKIQKLCFNSDANRVC